LKCFKRIKQKEFGLNVKSGPEIITTSFCPEESNRKSTPTSAPFNNEALEEKGERMEQEDAKSEKIDERNEELEPEADGAEEEPSNAGASVARASVVGSQIQFVIVQGTSLILRDLN